MSSTEDNGGNILLVANWPSNVGYAWWLMENFWTTIAEHFHGQGRRSFLAYPEINGIPDKIAASCISCCELDLQDHSPAKLEVLESFIRNNDIRCVYLSDYPTYSRFYLKLRQFGIDVIAIHDHSPGDRPAVSGAKRWFKSMLQRLPGITADCCIAVSEFVYDRFLEVSCVPAKKCHVARNGIRPIDIQTADSGYVRREFGISDTSYIIVTSSRAAAYKGIDTIIRCAARLREDPANSELRYLFCGDGPDLEQLRALACELKVDDIFIFAGKRDDVREILPGCNIGMHASHGEVGYSLSTIEYMSAGLVTIVPDLPSTSRATIHMKNGLIYRHGDIDSACEAIRKAMNKHDAEKLSRRAIADVQRYYSIDNTNRQLITILDTAFSAKGAETS